LLVAAAREDGLLIGIALLLRARNDGAPALLLVGSIEISDYLDLIVRAADLPRFLAGLLDFAASAPGEWSRLDWYNLPESSPTLAGLQAESGRRGWAYRHEVYRPTPVIALQGDFEAYLASVEKKQRHEIRRKLRRAEERGVRWYRLEDPAALADGIESMLTLMESDQHKAGFLKPQMREQMRAAMRAAHANGWLWLAFLEIDGQKAAAALNFDYRNRLWGYNSGVDNRFLEYSPGWVLLAHTLQWAAEHGRSEFDFMRGDEEYKYRFGAFDRHVMRVQVTR
jgi:hypothetical protein